MFSFLIRLIQLITNNPEDISTAHEDMGTKVCFDVNFLTQFFRLFNPPHFVSSWDVSLSVGRFSFLEFL